MRSGGYLSQGGCPLRAIASPFSHISTDRPRCPCLLLSSELWMSSGWCCLQINMTHYIQHLSFGEDYPGIVNPLDHTNVTAPQGTSPGGSPQPQKACRAPVPSALFSPQPP